MLCRTLDDGLTVWLDPMRDVRSAAVGVYVAGGSADEPEALAGATHFLEHVLFRRARRRSGVAIGRLIDRLGGDCDAYTTKETVALHARVPAASLADALGLLLDLTEAPAFTAEDVDVERAVILEEMSEANDVPEDRLHEAFVRAFWPEHPLGAPILGTEASVKALKRRDLAARFRAVFTPSRTAVVAVGAFEPEALLRLLDRLRRGRLREAGAAPASWRARLRGPLRSARCAFHLPRPDLNQTHLLVGATALPYTSRRVPAAWLATVVLGGGVSSRLWRDVRDRSGLAYHVGSGLTLHRQAGLALIEAATAPKNLPRLVRTTGRILKDLLRSGVTRAELSRAKAQARAEVLLGLESTSSRREAAARAWLYRGRPHEADEVIAELEAVRESDVEEVIGRLFGSPGPLSFGVTGPDLAGASLSDLAGELAA